MSAHGPDGATAGWGDSRNETESYFSGLLLATAARPGLKQFQPDG
jgi:hypothetical protein